MKHSINLEWKGDMAFQTEMDGHIIILDAPKDKGGNDLGPRPKILMAHLISRLYRNGCNFHSQKDESSR